jgi:hypothetical protein
MLPSRQVPPPGHRGEHYLRRHLCLAVLLPPSPRQLTGLPPEELRPHRSWARPGETAQQHLMGISAILPRPSANLRPPEHREVVYGS